MPLHCHMHGRSFTTDTPIVYLSSDKGQKGVIIKTACLEVSRNSTQSPKNVDFALLGGELEAAVATQVDAFQSRPDPAPKYEHID
jgi:hypothetical protein